MGNGIFCKSPAFWDLAEHCAKEGKIGDCVPSAGTELCLVPWRVRAYEEIDPLLFPF